MLPNNRHLTTFSAASLFIILLSFNTLAHVDESEASAEGDPTVESKECNPDEVVGTWKFGKSDFEDHVVKDKGQSRATIRSAGENKFTIEFTAGFMGDWPRDWKGICDHGVYQLTTAGKASIDRTDLCEHQPVLRLMNGTGGEYLELTFEAGHGGGKDCRKHESNPTHSAGGALHAGSAHGDP